MIILITYLVWRFCIRNRRKAFEENEWPEEDTASSHHPNEKGIDQLTLQRDPRASTHTVGSIASTVLTRASNIIQIAYIPGVTNRSVESSPDLLVPPVPPIPAASALSSPRTPGEDQHFFMPSDLRASTLTGYSDRFSTSPTMARDSVASTVYRSHAVVDPVPALSATRLKPRSVSVKSSGRSSPSDLLQGEVPPMPTHPLTTKSSIVGRVGTPKAVTITRNPSTRAEEAAMAAEAAALGPTKATYPDRANTASPSYTHDSSTFDDASSDEELDHNASANRSLMPHGVQSDSSTLVQESPGSRTAPFAPSPLSGNQSARSSPNSSFRDPNRRQGHKKSSSLNQIIQEATRRAAHDPMHGGLGSVSRDAAGPFSDAHMAATP